MEYLFPFLLTLFSVSCTIILLKKVEKKFLSKNDYRQSDIHKIIKPILFTEEKKVNKKTQIDNVLEKNSVNVMIVDNKAYWIFENVFYTADFVNNDVDPETSKPVDTSNMSKEDLDQMLFILDALRGGNKNDSSGTR